MLSNVLGHEASGPTIVYLRCLWYYYHHHGVDMSLGLVLYWWVAHVGTGGGESLCIIIVVPT